MKDYFTPISLDSYVKKHAQHNKGTKPNEIRAALISAIKAHKGGITCDCGNELWVLGSAFAGHACFSCITGESRPSDDYEIIESMD